MNLAGESAEIQAHAHRRGREGQGRRRGRDHAGQFHLLAVEHPRRATCRTRPSRWPMSSSMATARPICSWMRTQELAGAEPASGQCGAAARAGGICGRAGRAQGQDGAGRSGQQRSAIFDRLTKAGATVKRGVDPCQLPKACKNPVEIEGARKAHIRDGAALTRFLAWMAREAPDGHLTEIEAAEMLEGCRRETGGLTDLSFDSISGAAPHARPAPLPRDTLDQPHDQQGRDLSDRFRRAISRRHHRCDPHPDRRHADAPR